MTDIAIKEIVMQNRTGEPVKRAFEQSRAQVQEDFRSGNLFRKWRLRNFAKYYEYRNANHLYRAMINNNTSNLTMDVAREVAAEAEQRRANPAQWNLWRRTLNRIHTPPTPANAPGFTLQTERNQFDEEGLLAIQRAREQYQELTHGGAITREAGEVIEVGRGLLKQDIMQRLIDPVTDATTVEEMHQRMREYARTLRDRCRNRTDPLFGHQGDPDIQNFLQRFGPKNVNSQQEDFLGLHTIARGATEMFSAPEEFLRLAKETKADMARHRKNIGQMDQYVKIILSDPQWSHATQTEMTFVDRFVRGTQRVVQGTRFAYVLNPQVAAAVGSILAFVGTRAASREARTALQVISHVAGSWAVGAAIGTSIAAVRRWLEVKGDIAAHRGAMAMGGSEQSAAALPQQREPRTRLGRFIHARAQSILRIGPIARHLERRQRSVMGRMERVIYDMATPEELINGGGDQLIYYSYNDLRAINRQRREAQQLNVQPTIAVQHARESVSALRSALSATNVASQEAIARRAGEIAARINLYTHGSRQGALVNYRGEKTRDVINFGSRDRVQEGRNNLESTLRELRADLENTVGLTQANILIQRYTQEWTTHLNYDIRLKDRVALNHKAVETLWASGYSLLSSATFGVVSYGLFDLGTSGVGAIGQEIHNIQHPAPQVLHADINNTVMFDNNKLKLHLPKDWTAKFDSKNHDIIDIYDRKTPNIIHHVVLDPKTGAITTLPSELQASALTNANELSIMDHSQDAHLLQEHLSNLAQRGNALSEHLVVDKKSGLNFFLENGYVIDDKDSDISNHLLVIRQMGHPPIFHKFTQDTVTGAWSPVDKHDSLWLVIENPKDPASVQSAWEQLYAHDLHDHLHWQETHGIFEQDPNNYVTVDHHNFEAFREYTANHGLGQSQYAGYELYGHWGDGRNWANHGYWFNQKGTLSYGAIVTDQPIPSDLSDASWQQYLHTAGGMGFDDRVQALINDGILPPGSTAETLNHHPELLQLLQPTTDSVLQQIAHDNGGIISPDKMLAVVHTTDGHTLWLPIHKLPSGVLAAQLPPELQTSQGTPNPAVVTKIEWGFATDNANGHQTSLLKPEDYLKTGSHTGEVQLHVVASKSDWPPAQPTITMLHNTPIKNVDINFVQHVPAPISVNLLNDVPAIPIPMDPRFLPDLIPQTPGPNITPGTPYGSPYGSPYGGRSPDQNRSENATAIAAIERYMQATPYLTSAAEKDEAIRKTKMFLNESDCQQLGPAKAEADFQEMFEFILSNPDYTALLVDDGRVDALLKSRISSIIASFTSSATEQEELIQVIGKFILKYPSNLTSTNFATQIKVLVRAYRTTLSII